MPVRLRGAYGRRRWVAEIATDVCRPVAIPVVTPASALNTRREDLGEWEHLSSYKLVAGPDTIYLAEPDRAASTSTAMAAASPGRAPLETAARRERAPPHG
ncbi:hypothetical protein GCM10010390_47220 [Streptomyces mordarskii]|uniref:Uncharacterized protein n=1 Tax=Streptomyces mordarskii TaxID=1226758 RepID=A0ABN1DCL9_9ACTN